MPHLGSLLVVYENPIYNINRFVLQESGSYLEGVSDCEDLVGVTWRVSDCEELIGSSSQEMMGEGDY